MSHGTRNVAARGRLKPLVSILFVLLVGLTVSNRRAVLRSEQTADPVEEASSARALIYLTVEGIERFRDSTGAYPLALDRIGLDHHGIRYQVRLRGYSLVATVGSESIVYESGDDLAPYRRAMEDAVRRMRS